MAGPCPNCGFTPPPGAADHLCPACGLLFARWRPGRRARPPQPDWHENPLGALLVRLWTDLRDKASARRAELEADEPLVAGLRAALLVFLAWTGWRFAALNQPYGVWDHTFLHNVHLIFHEAGHILFIPFGRFMTIAGGSLMQLLVPLACLIAFLWREKPDPFGAAVCLWWLGTSFVDLSPYIGDAQSLKLMMLGGFFAEDVPDAHDWRNILYALDWLRYDRQIAEWAHWIGSALIVGGLGWGAWVASGVLRTRRT